MNACGLQTRKEHESLLQQVERLLGDALGKPQSNGLRVAAQLVADAVQTFAAAAAQVRPEGSPAVD